MTAFRFDYRPACEKELARDQKLGAHISRLVEKAGQTAKSTAPVNTGDYKASITWIPSRMTAKGFAGAYGSSSSFWHLVEYGSINNHPYRVLQKAARAAGLRFEDTGR